MYQWMRPRIAIPAHGEALHLSEHAAFARELGVPHALTAYDGDIVRLAPGDVAIAGKAEAGRLYQDGNLLVGAEDEAIRERRKLAIAGIVSVAFAVNGMWGKKPRVHVLVVSV